MQKINQALIVIAAFLVAGCAAFFSVTGLGNLFKSFSVMFMAGSLEYAKLVTAAYLKSRWEELGKFLRIYLAVAVLILMFITSMGIYGFLSDAFQNQSIRLEQVERQVSLLQNKININKSEIERYTKQNETSLNIRNSQEQNLSKLIDDKRATGRMSTMIRNADIEISRNSKKIDSLNTYNVTLYNQIDSVKNQNIDLEKEVGGFRFVAESFNVPLKTAVKWFILMIVFVFDPLAIALVLAYNTKRKKMEQAVEEKKVVKQYDRNWVVSMKSVQTDNEKKYSQNNEEGYIRHILATIGDGKFLVDLGAKDGFNQSNTRYFVEKGYQGLLIDSDDMAGESKEVKRHKIFSGNIIPLLRTYKCPKSFDLLSIDLDGTDYWVLKAILKNYNPKLIVAEFNPTLEQGKALTVQDKQDFKWEGDNYFGFSFEAGKKLGAEFGYTVIHQENNMNMFLVSNDFLNGVDVPEVTYEQSDMFKISDNTNWIEL